MEMHVTVKIINWEEIGALMFNICYCIWKSTSCCAWKVCESGFLGVMTWINNANFICISIDTMVVSYMIQRYFVM